MRFEHAKGKIGYPCIFDRSTEDSINNLLRLILNRECGFDEGAAAWRSTLQEGLDGPYDLLELNFCGASHSADQWRTILKGVIAGLQSS